MYVLPLCRRRHFLWNSGGTLLYDMADCSQASCYRSNRKQWAVYALRRRSGDALDAELLVERTLGTEGRYCGAGLDCRLEIEFILPCALLGFVMCLKCGERYNCSNLCPVYIYLSIIVSECVCVYLLSNLSVCLSIRLSVCPVCVCLYIRPPVFPSIHLPVCVSNCIFVTVSTCRI
jgi:hypothetical protein